jgi:hypothetical protein
MTDLPAVGSVELQGPATVEPPISGATAAIGSDSLVVTWLLTHPLDPPETPLLLTVWLPRHGGGPVQLGVMVGRPDAAAFAVDFHHRTVVRDTRVPVRITGRRIIALFPVGWIDDLEPVEVSHTSVSVAGELQGEVLALDFRRQVR